MQSSAPLGIPPELPTAHGPLLGDNETTRLPLPVSMLPPLTAPKRPVGALSSTEVVLFQTSPCTAEGSLRATRQVPFPPEGSPAIHLSIRGNASSNYAALIHGNLGICTQPCGLSARSAALY